MKRHSLCLALALACSAFAAAPLPEPTPGSLPRWRGFNLLERFVYRKNPPPFREQDFRLIAEMGFNFVRLPMDYRFWIRDNDWEQIDDEALKAIDEAIAYGRKYGVHVCLNFHRAPGWTVARPAEPRNLWKDAEAQRVCAKHWAHFARRYRGIPSRELSFNLFNEPGGDMTEDDYVRVVSLMAAAIRASKLRWRLLDQEVKPLTVDQAFYLGTLGGGRFFGKVGAFEKGYEFDAVVIDDTTLDHPQELTLRARLERCLYLADDRNLAAKYVRGKQVF